MTREGREGGSGQSLCIASAELDKWCTATLFLSKVLAGTCLRGTHCSGLLGPVAFQFSEVQAP